MTIETPAANKIKKLQSIQILRAVAAFLVLFGHIAAEAEERFGYQFPVLAFPWPIGVNLFFVISGFIMYHSSFDQFGKDKAIITFVKNRILRIVPLYYIFTSAMVIVVIFFSGTLGRTQLDYAQIVSSYLFFPYESYDGKITPVLSLGWTLNYEMFFYLIFGGSLYWTRKKAVIFTASTIIALVIVGHLLSPQIAAIRFWTSSIMIDFLVGIGIAAYSRNKKPKTSNFPMLLMLMLSAIALATWAYDANASRYLERTVPSAMIVLAFVIYLSKAAEDSIPSWATAFGDSSYSLYLSHRFPLRLLTILWGAMGFGNKDLGFLYILVTLIICLAVGHLVFLHIEVPTTKFLKRQLSLNKKFA